MPTSEVVSIPYGGNMKAILQVENGRSVKHGGGRQIRQKFNINGVAANFRYVVTHLL